jgi:hypothetical protein
MLNLFKYWDIYGLSVNRPMGLGDGGGWWGWGMGVGDGVGGLRWGWGWEMGGPKLCAYAASFWLRKKKIFVKNFFLQKCWFENYSKNFKIVIKILLSKAICVRKGATTFNRMTLRITSVVVFCPLVKWHSAKCCSEDCLSADCRIAKTARICWKFFLVFFISSGSF